MKITFFKNESDFYWRISYAWENAEIPGLSPKKQKALERFRKYGWVFSIPVVVFFVLFIRQIFLVNPWLTAVILIFQLPLHELCHALFCWISGRKVERICFFPYRSKCGPSEQMVAAYVKPAFGVWNQYQALLLFLFPILILTIFPLFLSIFISPIRFHLIFLALLNLSGSRNDMADALGMFLLPKNILSFPAFALLQKDDTKPLTVHQLSITPKLENVKHRQFTYFQGKLTEEDCAVETPSTLQLRKEFIQQFGLKE